MEKLCVSRIKLIAYKFFMRILQGFQAHFRKMCIPVNIYLFKVTIEALEKGLKYVQS